MAATYIKSALDPLDVSIPQPKLYDGSVAKSAGLRMKRSGIFACSVTGPTYVVLFPGYQDFCWIDGATGSIPTSLTGHLETPALRAGVKSVRVVSAGLKLSLLNTADQADGYFEAVRVQLNLADYYPTDTFQYNIRYGVTPHPNIKTDVGDLANHTTYQSGKLRDIDRYLFKLNSISPEHPFDEVLGGLTPANADAAMNNMYDKAWDCVVIKITGRNVVGQSSQIKYEACSNQELVFREHTVMSRLSQPNILIKDMSSILDQTRFEKPGLQVM